MGERLRDRLKIESRLRESIGGSTHVVGVQPKFDLRTRTLYRHGSAVAGGIRLIGDVAPTTFIGIAEESGPDPRVGRLGARQCLCTALPPGSEGLGTVPLAINLSARPA